MTRRRAHVAASAPHWRAGNRVRLLENGDEFFPRAFAAIAAAEHEVLLETFILFEDKVGLELHRHLVDAARRGVRVELTVDGWGSPSFSHRFVAGLVDAGVRFHVFDPGPKPFGLRLHVFRRMHRKLLVVDGRVAFVGGINFSADHLMDYGSEAMQDYSVELTGPIVDDIRAFTATQARVPAPSLPGDASGTAHGDARVKLTVRDNAHCRTDIERAYRTAIRGAKREVVIANAYFFPSHRLLSELRRAARRGVSVTLIVAARSDEPIATLGARALYKHLMQAGVRVYEYMPRPFHGKVAVIDDEWATIGSSNLDPLSLSLNLEANVFIRDAEFNAVLRARLQELRDAHCFRIDPSSLRGGIWQAVTGPIAYHLMRRFPRWAGLLPAHAPTRLLLRPRRVQEAPA
ncbi:cardiolipin synthase ClsB [Cognatilysobacter bugurensis]|uniref:Cardiolipin synthase B n=1 Tax=Cognatilysobacter bugurensis TaxID=543356 RepID=A0A918SU52_9GAMM|nr:cardiolipin synthase ClsB [Lysobacter bugurensis]GHA71252.1 cardiolipin synthase B [Lysobacter bugurensis]